MYSLGLNDEIELLEGRGRSLPLASGRVGGRPGRCEEVTLRFEEFAEVISMQADLVVSIETKSLATVGYDNDIRNPEAID